MQKAKEAKENMEQAAKEEQEGLSALEEKLNNLNTANAPVLLTGMTPIKFTMPTEDQKGEIIETTADDADWYSYGVKTEEKQKNGQMQKLRTEVCGCGYHVLHIE